MHVIAMDLGDLRVGDYDEGERAEGLNPVREAGGQDREGEVCAVVELVR